MYNRNAVIGKQGLQFTTNLHRKKIFNFSPVIQFTNNFPFYICDCC